MAMDTRESVLKQVTIPRSTLTTAQEEDDEKAHLLCVDGTIFQIPKGGNVLARTTHELDISVYA